MKRASIRPIDFQIEQLSKRVLREPFWWYSKPNISYHIHTIINNKRNSVPDMKNCVLERIYTTWKGYLKIYTDGSKQEDKSTGSAFYIPELGISKCYRISSINIMRAELTAIVMALEWIEQYRGMSVIF